MQLNAYNRNLNRVGLSAEPTARMERYFAPSALLLQAFAALSCERLTHCVNVAGSTNGCGSPACGSSA